VTSQPSRTARGETAWKWLLRAVGVAAFLYVLIVKDGDVPMGAYVLIAGLIGLPSVVGLQQAINKGSSE
jgi:hypothetical protein